MNVPRLLLSGWLGVILLTWGGGYGLAQDSTQQEAGQEEQEENEVSEEQPQEEKSWFQKMAEAVGQDIATSNSMIQVGPHPGGQSGNRPLSSKKGVYEGGEWVAAPVPVSNPTLGSGLAGGGGYIYRMDPADDVSPPTFTGMGGMYTSNESWAVAGIHAMKWKRDRFRLNAMGGFGNINMDFSGLGSIPGDDENRISVNIRGAFVETDFETRIFERVFGTIFFTPAKGTGPISLPTFFVRASAVTLTMRNIWLPSTFTKASVQLR
jgi:hypothetical protein